MEESIMTAAVHPWRNTVLESKRSVEDLNSLEKISCRTCQIAASYRRHDAHEEAPLAHDLLIRDQISWKTHKLLFKWAFKHPSCIPPMDYASDTFAADLIYGKIYPFFLSHYLDCYIKRLCSCNIFKQQSFC